jgi:hypothetical protein
VNLWYESKDGEKVHAQARRRRNVIVMLCGLSWNECYLYGYTESALLDSDKCRVCAKAARKVKHDPA